MATNTNRTNYTEEYLQAKSIYDLRKILRSVGGVPGGKGKGELIAEIMNIQTEHVVPPRSTRGRRPLEMKEFANNFEKRAISENGDEEEEISEQLDDDEQKPVIRRDVSFGDVEKQDAMGEEDKAEGARQITSVLRKTFSLRGRSSSSTGFAAAII